jgi:hypothetical protein
LWRTGGRCAGQAGTASATAGAVSFCCSSVANRIRIRGSQGADSVKNKKPRRQSPARPACSARTTGTFPEALLERKRKERWKKGQPGKRRQRENSAAAQLFAAIPEVVPRKVETGRLENRRVQPAQVSWGISPPDRAGANGEGGPKASHPRKTGAQCCLAKTARMELLARLKDFFAANPGWE